MRAVPLPSSSLVGLSMVDLLVPAPDMPGVAVQQGQFQVHKEIISESQRFALLVSASSGHNEKVCYWRMICGRHR